MKLKILHVSEFIKGGVSTYLNTLVREQLADPRIGELRIIANREHRMYLPDVPDEVIIPYDYSGRTVGSLNRLRRVLRKTVHEYQPNLVQLTSTFPGVLGRVNTWNRRWLTSSTSPAIVYCAQGWSFLMDTGALKKFTYRLIERTLALQADRIICISQNELECAVKAGISRERCDLVYNALPAAAPAAEPVQIPDAVAAARCRGDRVFLFVGRYDRQKGLDLLRPVFDGSPDRGDILLMAGGKAVDSDPVPLGSRMIDTGWATPGQVVTLLEQCDAMLVPSRWEGFGLVATEAMRAGKAVICSNRGGLPEVVNNHETGIVLTSLTSEEIGRVVGSLTPDTMACFGIAGLRRFRDMFTSEKMHEATINVYLRALKR